MSCKIQKKNVNLSPYFVMSNISTMKDLFKILMAVVMMVVISPVEAQSDVDAFRFSQLSWEGTARFMGAGGAFGAVGGEFSALSTNPASIGVYKRSEISFTPMNISVNVSNTNYNGVGIQNNSVRYSISNAGAVFAIKGSKSSDIKNFQLGFGYNRVANFNNQIMAEGYSEGGSIANVYAMRAEGYSRDHLDSWPTDLYFAWESWLIEPKPGIDNSYYSPLQSADLYQSYYSITQGGIDEMTFSFGGNYKDFIYYGATLGVPFANYTEFTSYSEEDLNNQDTIFNSLEIESNLKVKGTGVNLKLGLLIQPKDFVRLGFAFHTPTWYGKLRDSYVVNYYSQGEEGTVNLEQENYYQYRLSTPLRAMFNTAFFIKKRAFISAEYEICDYSMANMSPYEFDSYSFKDENAAINDKYGISHIVRVGAELTCTKNFLLRAGYSYKSSPYKNKINDGSEHIGSAGIGFRGKYMFVDMAYQITATKENFWFYDPDLVSEVNGSFLNHRIVLSIGVKF